ncbi:DUF2569 domain-containing protein [Cedecea neteri]|uniref:DUF2569 domain-containing protein n=1 Tax=Cedecea neteri TaxID=158822 RepID=UPI002AA5E49A|nr:DUF2569 domain-containing protein [Cedecea neteri]WPU22606.1 DUF2569 domain-containing protein [Cedecea neteri]
MATCIQCDNEAIKGSDYCPACEEKEFKRIRGWLYVPALGLVLSVLFNFIAFVNTLKLFINNYSVLIGEAWWTVLFEVVGFAGLFVAAIYVSSLFFRKKRQLPRYYIVFMVAGIVFQVLDLYLARVLFDVPFDFDNAKALMRSFLGACIWVPYFCVSERVKRTFVR